MEGNAVSALFSYITAVRSFNMCFLAFLQHNSTHNDYQKACNPLANYACLDNFRQSSERINGMMALGWIVVTYQSVMARYIKDESIHILGKEKTHFFTQTEKQNQETLTKGTSNVPPWRSGSWERHYVCINNLTTANEICQEKAVMYHIYYNNGLKSPQLQ